VPYKGRFDTFEKYNPRRNKGCSNLWPSIWFQWLPFS